METTAAAPAAPAVQSAPEAPKSNADAMQEAFAEALKQEGVVQVEGKNDANVTTPPAEKPKEEAPPAAPEKSWEKLMQEKADLRKQQEALKNNPQLALNAAMDPGSVQALLRAKQAGDPMGVLTALGFTYGDVARRILETEPGNTPPPPKEAPKEVPKGVLPPELEQEIVQMRAYVAQQQRKEILGRVKEVLPADKFKLISSMNQHEGVLQFVQDFHTRTGELPGNTFEESITTAAEALERKLSQEAEKWRKVLTPAQAAAIVQPEAQREPQSSGPVTSPASKTLTNGVAAPAPTKPEPTTREEVISGLLKDPEFLNSL